MWFLHSKRMLEEIYGNTIGKKMTTRAEELGQTLQARAKIMCSGPFSGAQVTPTRRRAQAEGAAWIGSVAKWRLKPIASA